MLRILCVCAYLAFCQGYGVGSSVHTVAAPIAVPYVRHGYGGHEYNGHGYGGHGYSGHGYGIGGYGVGHELGHGFIKPVLHHILKRSPHYVQPFPQAGHLASVTPIVAVAAPFAVSHQARVDVHSAPAIVKQIVTPFVQAAPVYHSSFGHYGGVNGLFHPHIGRY